MKRLITSTMILITVTAVLCSAYLANSVYEKYNKSIEWKNSSLLSRIHEVPPSLAQDFISVEEQKLFQLLTDVNVALENIIENEEVPTNRTEEYWELYESAKEHFEASGLYESTPIRQIFEDFSLYLKADQVISNAYEELNVELLDEHAKIFADRLAKRDSALERSFLNDLRKISNDYKELNEFSKNTISKLGVVEGDKLLVKVKVNREVSDSVLADIASKGLTKFPHIENLVGVLKSDSWTNILTHNKSVLEYYSWKDSEKILRSLLKANYISISSFKTIEDVLSYNSSYPLKTKENHNIEDDSLILGVYYQGQELSEDLYIKKGSPLTFDIDYNYKEKEKSTVTIEYLDENGDNIYGVNDEVFTDYVGNSVNLDIKDIDGYVFVQTDNNLNVFPDEDSTVKVIYKKEPEPESETEPESELDEEEDGNLEEDDLEDNEDDEEDEGEEE